MLAVATCRIKTTARLHPLHRPCSTRHLTRLFHLSLCTILKVAKSSSSVGANLTRSVTSSIRLARGCGHQEGLSNFHTTPRFVVNTPFPLPIFSSTLLLERGTLITSGVLSRIRPRLGLSLSPQCLSPLSSLSRTSVAPPPHSFCGHLRLPSPRRGCTPFPSLQKHTGTLPFC